MLQRLKTVLVVSIVFLQTAAGVVICAHADDTIVDTGGLKIDPYQLDLKQLGELRVQSIDFFETSLDRAPNNLTVLNHTQLERHPHATLEQHIQFGVAGAHMVRHGVNGPNLGTRGFGRGGSTSTLAMWDGRAMNNRDYEGYQIGYLSPMFYDLEQVEVALGPGSLIHGTGAFYGFVNYVPKSGSDHQGLHTDFTTGFTDRLIRGQFGYGERYGEDSSIYLYGGFAKADGFEYDYGYGETSAPHPMDGKGKVSQYEPSFRLSGNLLHDRFQVTGMFERLIAQPNTVFANGPRVPMLEKHMFVLVPRYTFELGERSFIEISPSVVYQDQSVLRVPRFESDIGSLADFEDGGSESSAQLRVSLQSKRWRNHNITLGGVIDKRSLRPLRQFFSQDADTDNIQSQGRWREGAIYAEDKIQVTDRLQASMGLRYDWARYNEFTGNTFNSPTIRFRPNDQSGVTPRVQAQYDISDRQRLKFTYQEGFGYPGVSAYPRLIGLNRFLRSIGEEPFRSPESVAVETFELGYSGTYRKDTLGFDVSLFHNKLKDVFIFRNLLSEPFILSPQVREVLPANLASVVFNSGDDYGSVGGEINTRWQPTSTFRLKFGYAYASPSQLSDRVNNITNLADVNRSSFLLYPKHQVKGSIEYDWKQWNLTTSFIYAGGVDRLNPPPEPNPSADAHFRVNVKANYNFSKDWALALSINNLFGNVTAAVNTNPQPWFGTLGADERRFYLGVTWKPEK